MITVLGLPYDANSSFLRGPALAPPRIRQMDKDGSANSYSETGIAIQEGLSHHDVGDLFFPDTRPEAGFSIIKNAIASHLQKGEKILSLGGDHSVTYPILAAYREYYPTLHILHIDAHGDLYDNFDNNLYSHASPFARIMEQALADSLTQAGVRTYTPHQREQMLRFGVKAIEMKDWDAGFVEKLEGPLYLSLDIDALDPAFAPGVSHHEPGGLSVRDVLGIIQGIKVPIVGADIVELNPARDLHDQTAMVAYKFFKEIIAKML